MAYDVQTPSESETEAAAAARETMMIRLRPWWLPGLLAACLSAITRVALATQLQATTIQDSKYTPPAVPRPFHGNRAIAESAGDY